MDINKLVAKNIKCIRELKSIKQEQISLTLDTYQSYISSIESGKTKISLNRLSDIAKILDVEPYILLKPDLKEEIDKKILK